MTAVVNEDELLNLEVGDFVAIYTTNMDDGKLHWTLGTVETPPYLRDVEVRLWEKQKAEFYNEDDVPENPEMEALMNRIAQVKTDLQQSMEQADNLTQQLRARRAAIMQQIGEADEYVAESRAVMHAARDDVESIPDRYWQELKSYRVPPKMVLLVLRAVMLLLSEDEARTWGQMQRILRDFNFKTRITSYNPEEQLSPERREYILQECVSKKSFRYDRAMQGSVAVGPIYYWVLAQLDCGEAQSQKRRVDQEKVARQKELRQVLQQINEQQHRIAEYQEMMDDLDDQLRVCHQHSSKSPRQGGQRSASRSRRRGLATSRYHSSFAGEQNKEYLKPAFYSWRPTDRVIIVLRKNIICNFGGVTSQEKEEGYNLSEPQVRMLDEALARRQRALEELGGVSDAELLRREQEEAKRLEDDLLKKNEGAGQQGTRGDDDIMREREQLAAMGKPTPMHSPKEGDGAAGMGGAEASDKLQRTFEGKNWQRILERKRMAICNTFTEETAECLDVPEHYISITDMTNGSLIVDFEAQHDGSRSKGELQSRVNACGYPKMMALYEEEEAALLAEDEEVPEHQMKFGGDRWSEIIAAHHDEVLEAFLADTNEATSVSQSDIKVIDIRAEGDALTVDYSIVNGDISPEEVQNLVDEYEYPRVWALYQRLTGQEAGIGMHQVRFRGERWEELLATHEDEIRAAFVTDTAKALDLEEAQVESAAMRYDRGLTVPYSVPECPLSEDDIDQRVEDYKYPETWTLYDRLIAEATGAAYQKAFDGAHWEAVLSEARPALTEAFRNDSADALKVPVETVEPCSLDTDQNRLLVSYNVDADSANPESVQEDTKDYEYPQVWAVYDQVVEKQEAAKANMTHPFPGPRWGEVYASHGDELRAAFSKDVSDAINCPPEQVTVSDVTIEAAGMTVHYGVEKEGILESEVRSALEESSFPTLWELYKQITGDDAEAAAAAAAGLRGAGTETAILERRFDGDDWDILVDGCPEDVNEAFRTGAAKALGVSPSQIRVVSAEIGSLVVKYQVISPEDDEEEISRKVAEHDFPELMSLYKARLRAAGMGDGEDGAEGAGKGGEDDDEDADKYPPRSFDGDNWEAVVGNHRAASKKAFQKDTADALGVKEEDVQVVSAEADDLTATFKYKVKDANGKTKEEVATIVEEYPYPYLWELYERVENGEEIEADETDWVTTSHQVGFDGDDWGYVLGAKRDDLEEAFTICTVDLFELEVRHIVAARYSLGSLIVDFDLKHPESLTEEEINKALAECPYEPVWDLYGEHPYDPNEVTHSAHELGFEGIGWATVMVQREEALKDAVEADTAVALDVLKRDVKVVSLEYAEEALLVKVDVLHSVLQDEELIQEQLTKYPYDAVWALYEEEAECDFVTTQHQVGFDGDDWQFVVDKHNAELRAAFVGPTVEAFELEPRHLTQLQFTVEGASLLADFQLFHAPEVTEEEINKKLADLPYTAVWDLYGDHPYDPSEVATTQHELGFEGDEWPGLMKTQDKELREAISLDTAEALEVEPENVQNIEMEFVDNALVVRITVVHSVLQDQDLIQEQLSSYPYSRVWELYENAPVMEGGLRGAGTETAILERRFDGDDWDILVDGCPEDVNEAFRTGAAKALGVSPSQIRVVSAEIGSLVVKYQVISPEDDDDVVARRVNEHDFPELMSLYRARIRGGAMGDGEDGAEGAGKGGEDADKYPPRSFDGDNWEPVVQNHQEELKKAFQSDTADALGVKEEDVQVVSVEADDLSITFKYTVKDEAGKTKEEVATIVEEYPYPGVWELYEQTENEQAAAAAVAGAAEEDEGQYEKSFPGEKWVNCVPAHQKEIEEAFKKDIAAALGVPAEQVTVRSVKATEESGVRFRYDLAPPPEVTEEEVQEKTKSYAFPEVWAVYEELGNMMTSSHTVSFEAEGWDFIVRRRRWELARAIADDAAEAMSTSPDNAVDMHMNVTPDCLNVTVQIQHSQDKSPETVDVFLQECPFERVWALYELLAPSGDITKTFAGEGWVGVLQTRPETVKRAFANDTAKVLSISRLEVEVRKAEPTAEGMEVVFSVRGSSWQDDEIAERVEQYPYPEVWGLYDGSLATDRGLPPPMSGLGDADRESGQLQRVFEGDDWDILVDGCRGDVEDAFKTGAGNCLGIPASNVDVIDARVGSLVMDYKVRGCVDEDEEISRKVNEHDFPELMSLYKARVRAGESGDGASSKKGAATAPDDNRPRTRHQVGFDGEDWGYVVKTNGEALTDAFVENTADQLECDIDDIVNVQPTVEGQLLFDFEVCHGTEITEAEIDEILKGCGYEDVWALYGTHPYDPNVKVTTEHAIGFEGEDWDYVVETKRDVVLKTFKEGTANALTVPPSDVTNIQVEKTADGVILTCSVSHSPLQDEELMQEELQRYPYDELWALYEVRPYDPTDKIVSLHEVQFEGDAWGVVVKAEPEALRRAVVGDTATALELPQEDIIDVHSNATATALIVRVRVQHSPLMDTELIQEMMSKYEYNNVWALYDNAVESAVMSKKFSGDGWPTLVENYQHTIVVAFQNDTGNMLNLPPRYICVKSTTTDEEGLTVKYTLFGSWFTEEEVVRRADVFPFPEVWALYKPSGQGASSMVNRGAAAGSASAAEPYQVIFAAEQWSAVLSERRADLTDAFKRDTADAVPADKAAVEIVSMYNDKTSGLIVNFRVNSSEAHEEVESRVQAYAYPQVWELYDQVEAEHTTAAGVEVTEPTESEAQAAQAEQQGAVKSSSEAEKEREAAAAAAAAGAGAGGLGAGDRESGLLDRKFEGSDWDILVDGNRAGVDGAFRQGVSQCLGVEPSDVEVVNARIGSLIMEYKVRGCADSDEEIRRKVAEHGFPELMAMYKARVRSTETGDAEAAAAAAAAAAAVVGGAAPSSSRPYSVHEVTFEGEDWEFVMAHKAAEVHLALQNDTAEALHIPQDHIEDVNTAVSSTGLVVKARVKRAENSSIEATQTALEEYDFPRTWAWYCPPSEAPSGAKHFDGEWANVAEEKRRALMSAFAADSAKALSVAPADVEVTDIDTADGLTMKYTVNFTQSTAEDVETLLDNYPYPAVWALYAPGDASRGMTEMVGVVPGEENFIRTHHEVGFAGEDWAYTVRVRDREIKDAFKEETADLFGLEPRHVKDLRIETNAENATMEFDLEHAPELTTDDVDNELKDAPYDAVWELYNTRPYDPNDVVTTHQDVGFEGEDWDHVMKTKKEEVEAAFVAGVAAALEIEPSAVAKVEAEKTSDGIIIGAEVTHSRLQDQELIQEQLKRYAFDELWALYEARPFDPNEFVESKHSISFEGEEWSYIMAHKAAEVHLAIQNDSADALTLQPDSITDVQSKVEAHTLVAVITVRHSPLQDNELIQEELSKYDYDRVWALYLPPSEAPRGGKHFDGDWTNVAEEKRRALMSAFATDSAKALNVPASDVTVTDIDASEGLTVHYTVNFTQSTAEEVETILNRYPYPAVWALYAPNTATQGLTEISQASHSRVFAGTHWDAVVREQRQPLKDAFTSETASAVGTNPENVQVSSFYTTKQGLVMNYRVTAADAGTDEEVDSRVQAHKYPQVWDLYGDGEGSTSKAASVGAGLGGGDRESGQLQRVFEGDDWDILIDGNRGALEGAFKTGAGKCLGIPASNVDVIDARVGSLVMDYKVRGCMDEDEEISRKMAAHDFPELMSLYKARVRSTETVVEESAKGAGQPALAPLPSNYRYTDLSVSFDGEDWDYVLERKSAKVTDAFKTGTARALKVRKNDVTITEFVLGGSLVVQFRARHPAAMVENEMRNKIDAYPYEEVWALYEERPGDIVTTFHEVGFEAENWEYVDSINHGMIVEAFRNATATACELTPEDIRDIQVLIYPSMMKVACNVAHRAGMQAGTVNTRINRYPYEEVWALYEDPPVGKESGELRRVFDGDDWDVTLEKNANAVREAFRADTMRCLKVPRSCVTVKNMTTGSLVIEYTVRSADLTDEVITNLVESYPYPEVWALYQPRQGATYGVTDRPEGASQQRLFKGASWDVVVDKKRSELREAFSADTAEALGTSAEHVQTTSLYTTEAGLVMNYRADPDGKDRDAVDKAVREADYQRVWELYRQYADEGYVTSEHMVGFDGEDWDYVMEKNASVLTDTFTMCTAELMGLQSRHIQNVSTEANKEGVTIGFTLSHPPTMNKAEIDAKLEACPYDAVWQLYETRPFDPSVVIVTSHEVRFDGEDWDYTIGIKRDAVEAAFIKEIAAAMQVEPSAVNGVRMEKTESGIVIGVNVQHSPLLDHEMAEEDIARHSFPSVWALYTRRPYDAKKDKAASMHQVGFEGDRWGDVMAARRADVVRALRTDTATALGIAAEDVIEVSTEESPSMMLATLTVQHPRAQTTDMVQDQLSQYDYDRVWALYEDVTNPHVDVMKTRSPQEMSSLMTKRFDGVDWDLALHEQPENLRAAFVQDTAAVLQCSTTAVVIDGMALGSLVVQFRVRGLPMTEAKATSLTDNYAYPNVWSLYKSRLSKIDDTPAPSTTRTPALSSARRSARAPPPPPPNPVDEEKARREAEAAQRAAAEAKRAEEAAADDARRKEEQWRDAEQEAQRAEEELRRRLQEAQQRREAAKQAAAAARKEEERRAKEAYEEAQRALEAAKRAEEAAEEARRRRVQPLGAEEMEEEQDSVKYLRKALAEARRERDEYLDMAERANERQQQLEMMEKDLNALSAPSVASSTRPSARR